MSVTDTFYPTPNNWDNRATRQGIKFTVNSSIIIESAVKYPNSEAASAQILDSSFDDLDSATFSGNTVTFTGEVTLETENTYYLVITPTGGNRSDMYTSESYPLNGTNINVTASVAGEGEEPVHYHWVSATSTDAVVAGAEGAISVTDSFVSVVNLI